jgi:hypothetical protein
VPSRPPPPPEGLEDAIRQVSDELLPSRMGSTRQSVVRSGARASEGETTVASPRPLYNLGLDSITQGRGLDAATPVGWRTLVAVANTPVALADADAESDGPRVRAMNYGPFVDGLARAEEMGGPEAGGGDAGGDGPELEERILQVPGVYFVGLWLHDEADPGNDVIVPVAPAPPGLVATRRYAAADVLAELATLAEARLATDDHGVDDGSR